MSSLRCGLVGLPNVGKSTLFNALTQSRAAAENYPFCTLDPNVGEVAVPDPRLERIAKVAGSARVVPAKVQFVDVAGLIRGAAGGEGLGNRFLGHLREVTAVVQVVRCFADSDVTHVDGRLDPLADIETIGLELALADLESVQKAREKLAPRVRTGEAEARALAAVLDKAAAALEQGRPLRDGGLSQAELQALAPHQLLTQKPMLLLANTDEQPDAQQQERVQQVREAARQQGMGFLALAVRLEAELAELDPQDRQDMARELGLQATGLELLVREAARMLGLDHFFTAGPEETRAWAIPSGVEAPRAAGEVHTDMQRGFIAAEIVHCSDFLELGGAQECKKAGKWRSEGREYRMADGDIALFRFNV